MKGKKRSSGKVDYTSAMAKHTQGEAVRGKKKGRTLKMHRHQEGKVKKNYALGNENH